LISEEPDDIEGDFVKSLEERIDEYGGMEDTNKTLLSAVIAGDKTVIIALLEADADVNTRTEQHRTPLILAASDDQKLIARTLLESGADISASDESGLTALHVACAQGFHAMCTLLIQNGADLEAKSLEGGKINLICCECDINEPRYPIENCTHR
jgi:ankyrin repeat protein